MIKRYIYGVAMLSVVTCSMAISNHASEYDINKISGFSENWQPAELLSSGLYRELKTPINIAFITNKISGANIYWGNPNADSRLDPNNPMQLNDYITQSGHPASQFMVSFGGATNRDGWSLLSQSTSPMVAIELADNLAAVANSANLAGVDVDVDVPPSDSNFKANFKAFISELKHKLGNKNLSLDLPNLGGCTDSSGLSVCTWSRPWAGNIGNAVWFFQGSTAIDSYVDYYNVMSYSWGAQSPDKALQYSEDAVQSYMDLGVSASRLNYGLDLDEDNDRDALTTDTVNSVVRYVTQKELRGIFIWDYNSDQQNSEENNYGNTSMVTALTADLSHMKN